VPTAANGQPTFAFYRRFQGTEWRAHSIQLLELDGDEIASLTSFVSPSLFQAFGLPLVRSNGP
jgi:RNA polymerase sigma-70 factor (ECF subfamily)